MKRRVLFSWFTILILLAGSVPVSAAPPVAAPAAPVRLAASNWCLVGSLQPDGGWNNTSDPLYDDGTHGDLLAGDGVYTLDYAIAKPAGRYEWKVTTCGSWAPAYPNSNSWVNTVASPQTIRFTFDANTYSDGYLPAKNIVHASDVLTTSWTAVGSWQGWNNANPATAMTGVAPGLYVLTYTVATVGTYLYKVAQTGNWDAVGADGRGSNADNASFTTTTADQVVAFYLDATRGRIRAVPAGTPGTAQWYLRGGMNGWSGTADQLYDNGTHGDILAGDGIYSLAYVFTATSTAEWKITVNDWSENYPPSNAWLNVTAGRTVLFTLDTNTYADGWYPQTNIAQAWDDPVSAWTAMGDWQGENNADAATAMFAWGPGQYVLTDTVATAGPHTYRAARTGLGSYFGIGGRGTDSGRYVDFQTYSPDQVVGFFVDTTRGRIKVYAPPPAAYSRDGIVALNGLYHDSRDDFYRQPFGAVTVGTAVKLHFRSYQNDLTGVRVHVVDDVLKMTTAYPMTLVNHDGAYDYWEYTLPTDHATLLWYRFEAQDGAARGWYGDESDWWSQPWVKGGAGLTSNAASGVGSYQLTVYLPDYTTPDWLRTGNVYQIFPDRFRNGNPANDVISGTFYYGNDASEMWGTPQVHTGTVAHTTWNEQIWNPRAPGAYYSTYSNQFYGGDLQGIIDKLDYLKSAGFTVLYLNPIFKSPSNHKYDTTDYTQIDPAFGDEATFTRLMTEAQARGMHVILDGVFNHTSSDSLYFDKYSRWDAAGQPTAVGADDDSGAYESQASPYADWFTFSNWPTDYSSWWGYLSLPKLNSSNPVVRSYIYSGTDPIATRWVMSGTQRLASGWRFDVAGDVDPGYANAPTNGYWTGFRSVVRGVYSQTAMIAEDWGNASAFLLGNQMDSVMNYRFRNALLGFVRDTSWADTNTTFPHQKPAQFFATLQSLQEDYPAPAWYAMLNLVGTHDTNRLRFVVSESGDVTATVDARQQLTALAQFSLPGAPTVYYGDEVGASADGVPCSAGSATTCGDPYNRLPYPWADTPGDYTQRPGMLTYYAALANARQANPALQAGSLDLLLADDTAGTLAYGRRLGDNVAVAVFNRQAPAQTVTVDVTGYLQAGTVLTDVLTGTAYTAVAAGDAVQLSLTNLAGNAGALLVASAAAAVPAAPVLDSATEGDAQVVLQWTGSGPAYNIYRSLVSGGGYTRVLTETASTVFTDTTVANGTLYYYVATTVAADKLESVYSNELSALPHAPIDWAGSLLPAALTHTLGLTPTSPITAQVYISDVTTGAGQGAGVLAQIGYGLSTTAPADWPTWMPMTYLGDVGNNDLYTQTLLPEAAGTFDYLARFSTTSGRDWTYAYVSGTTPGTLTVNAAGDTTAPGAPLNLRLRLAASTLIAVAWDAPPDPDVYAYDLYRESATEPLAVVARILAPTLVYTDETVLAGEWYTYTVKAVDTAFNVSPASNELAAQAVQRPVTVIFNVTVPAFTPAAATICIPGDNAAIMGSAWDPSTLPMTKVDALHWTRTLTVTDGLHLQYKYTRCSGWNVVEWWGAITGTANRQLDVTYGTTGEQVVDDTVGNWRDPLVVSQSPAPGAADVSRSAAVTVIWSRPLISTTVSTASFKLASAAGAVSGTVSYISGTTDVRTVFTPEAPLGSGTTYTATLTTAITGQDNENATLQVPMVWSFMTEIVTPTYTITPTAGAGGSITPATPQTVNEGDNLTFTIAANTGYHIVDVEVDGVSVGPVTSYTFTNVTADHTLTATFALTRYLIYLPLIRR